MTDATGMTEEKALEAREKYVIAWNELMVQIWQEQITLLNVLDTKSLLNSVAALPVRSDGRFTDLTLSHEFNEYGIWQDYGVGKETPVKGRADEHRYRDMSTGQLHKEKLREARHWFSRKYFASVMKIKEFLAESIGEEFIGAIADVVIADGKQKIRY